MNSRHDPDWDARVRPIIRTRLQSGLLRAAPAAQTWAGPGIDKLCDACMGRIENHDTEFEVIFHDGRGQRFHAGCHIVWEEERDRESVA